MLIDQNQLMVATSSPDKIMFPEHTKGELVAYYRAFAARMLPHVVNRPVTLERFPGGIEAKGFMQKNAAAYFPDYIGRYEVPKRDGVTTYPVITDAEGIVYLANQNTVTFHTPTARIDEHPDRLIVDLDPEEGDVDAVREAAFAMRALMEELEFLPLVMTSGSKGYHLVAPIVPSLGYDDVGQLAHGIAAIAVARHPELLTIEFLKKNRKGRVFVDWMRNRDGATAVAPYSLRARPSAPIAMPLAWEEVADTDPRDWTLSRAADRRAEPWPDFLDVARSPEGPHAEVRNRVESLGLELLDVDRFGRHTQ